MGCINLDRVWGGAPPCTLNIDQIKFQNLSFYYSMRHEQSGKRHITSYYTKMSTAIMKMYRTENEVNTPEEFRSELSQFV